MIFIMLFKDFSFTSFRHSVVQLWSLNLILGSCPRFIVRVLWFRLFSEVSVSRTEAAGFVDRLPQLVGGEPADGGAGTGPTNQYLLYQYIVY